MNKQLVYDLPTRLFHWLFATYFLLAFLIAKNVDDESIIFTYHMLAGLSLGFLVVLRIVWGLFGSKHARFSGFALNPFELFSYFKGILANTKKRWAGHNPASSWAAIIMMMLTLCLVTTGWLMTSGGDKEPWEDAHELFANSFMIVAIAHIAGVALHTVRYREFIGFSMITGKKNDTTSENALSTQHSGIGILLIAVLVGFTYHLASHFDSQAKTLQLFGTTLQLGENENENENENETHGAVPNETNLDDTEKINSDSAVSSEEHRLKNDGDRDLKDKDKDKDKDKEREEKESRNRERGDSESRDHD